MTENVDQSEIAKFESLAHLVVGPGGATSARCTTSARCASTTSRGAVELVGNARHGDRRCGGGILAEAMAARGARRTGCGSRAKAPLVVSAPAPSKPACGCTYRQVSAEALAARSAWARSTSSRVSKWSNTCRIRRSIVAACATLAKPGGHVFLSTINRNPKAWALAVVGCANMLLDLVPRGTHDYRKVHQTGRTARARSATPGSTTLEIIGMAYNPFTRSAELGIQTST